MSIAELPDLLRTLLDKGAKPDERVAAARRLAEWDIQAAMDALLQVAQDDDANESVVRAASEGLAQVLIRRREVDQVPLHDFTRAASVGYDEAIARHLRGNPA